MGTCADCRGKRDALAENVCSGCDSTMCEKCWKRAGNALVWSNMMIFGWGAALFSSGKKRYKCKSCRSKSDLVAIGFIVILLGAFMGFAWYTSSN